MEISIKVDTVLHSSTAKDHTELYRQNIATEAERQFFTKGLQLASANNVFTYSGAEDLLPPKYVPATMATSAKVGDVYFADPADKILSGYPKSASGGSAPTVKGIVQVVGRSNYPVPKQPELYPVETDFGKFSHWTRRYAKIKANAHVDSAGNLIDFMNLAGQVKHRLYQDPQSPTGWTYAISDYTKTSKFWGEAKFSMPDAIAPNVPKYYVHTTSKGNHGWDIEIYYDDKLVAHKLNDLTQPTANTSTYTADTSGPMAGSLFMIGDEMRSQTDAAGDVHTFCRVKLQETKGEVALGSSPAQVHNFIDSRTPESQAFCTNAANCDHEFILRTFILRGTDLYARTGTDAVQETVTNTNPFLQEVVKLEDFIKGWTFTRPVAKLAPFDAKKYTAYEGYGEVEFVVDVPNGKFDTIALGGLIADEVTIELYHPPATANGGYGSAQVIDKYIPDCRRDPDYRLPPQATTAILYSTLHGDIKPGGRFKVTLKGAQIKIGTIMAGLSVKAGFTNLTFSNKYIDYSPYEKDQWGNILYVDGVRINVYSGSVDVPIRQYDMMNRLMISLGSNEVILNGSDANDNLPPDNEKNIFASTMVIGRIRDFNLNTRLDNRAMAQMAQYKFTIEESI